MSIRTLRVLAATWCVLAGVCLWGVFLMGARDAAPLALTATVGSDGDTVYYDAVINGTPHILARRLSAWNRTPRIVARNACHPYLTRNGRAMFFERQSERGGTEIWRHEVDSGQQSRVYSTRHDAYIHDVDHEGTRLIITVARFAGGLGAVTQEHLIDGKNGDVLFSDIGFGACFVTDGGVVFSAPASGQLRLLDKEGRVLDLNRQGYFPRSSLSGQKVLFVRDLDERFNRRQWQVLDLVSNKVQMIRGGIGPALGPDDNSVILQTELNAPLLRFDLTTGVHSPMTQSHGAIAKILPCPGGVAARAEGPVNWVIVITEKAIYQEVIR